MKALARYQVILLGEQRHIEKQLVGLIIFVYSGAYLGAGALTPAPPHPPPLERKKLY